MADADATRPKEGGARGEVVVEGQRREKFWWVLGRRHTREWFGRRTRWELVAEWSETVGYQILNQSVLERHMSECLRGT